MSFCIKNLFNCWTIPCRINNGQNMKHLENRLDVFNLFFKFFCFFIRHFDYFFIHLFIYFISINVRKQKCLLLVSHIHVTMIMISWGRSNKFLFTASSWWQMQLYIFTWPLDPWTSDWDLKGMPFILAASHVFFAVHRFIKKEFQKIGLSVAILK